MKRKIDKIVETTSQKSFFRRYCSDIALPCKWNLKISSAGIFVHLGKSLILMANGKIIGQCMNHVVPRSLALLDNHEIIAANGFTGILNGSINLLITKKILINLDSIYVCNKQMDSEIFAYSVQKSHFASLPSYINEKKRFKNSECAKVDSIAANRERLYLLDATGNIHFRENIVKNKLIRDEEGSWEQISRKILNFKSLYLSKNLAFGGFKSMCVSTNGLWLIDSHNKIFFIQTEAILTKFIWEASELDKPYTPQYGAVDQVNFCQKIKSKI